MYIRICRAQTWKLWHCQAKSRHSRCVSICTCCVYVCIYVYVCINVYTRRSVSVCKCISIHLCIVVHVMHKLESSDTVRQNAGTALVSESLAESWEPVLWRRITTNLIACGMQQRFRNQNGIGTGFRKEISRKSDLITTALIFDCFFYWFLTDFWLITTYFWQILSS